MFASCDRSACHMPYLQECSQKRCIRRVFLFVYQSRLCSTQVPIFYYPGIVCSTWRYIVVQGTLRHIVALRRCQRASLLSLTNAPAASTQPATAPGLCNKIASCALSPSSACNLSTARGSSYTRRLLFHRLSWRQRIRMRAPVPRMSLAWPSANRCTALT